MIYFGYDAPQEQFPPDKLLEYAVIAEKSNFDFIGTSDHFHPWINTGSHCGFAWVWIASAAERTRYVKLGTMVTAPILRYNPAIVAQAFATLGYMYPNRIFLGVGAGEALNESPVGCTWPSPRERVERVDEALKIIRLLWTSEYVDYEGKYYKLSKAKLFTKPKTPIPIYVAAGGPKMAEVAGKYGDGIITLVGAFKQYGDLLLKKFEDAAKSVGKDISSLRKIIFLNASYGDDLEEALEGARFWKCTTIPALFKYNIYDPREIEANSWAVGDEALLKVRLITTSAEENIKAIEYYVEKGFDTIFIMNVSKYPEKLFKVYSEKVIPYFKNNKT
ncbi:MAG: TIGR03557 family F420-dependent LLM class oxidoreductase [Nitrososphaeria archaeon]